MMGERTVGDGKMVRHTVTGCVQAPRDRENTPGPGSVASRSRACIRGPVEIIMKASGFRANVMALGWRPKGAGYTVENGRRGSKAATAYVRARHRARATKALGQRGSRMDTVVRPMQMEVGVIRETSLFKKCVLKLILFHSFKI